MANQYTELEGPKTWIDEMVEREALPRELRVEKVEEFAKRVGVSEETYYYQKRKPANQKRILEITLNLAKDRAPDILKVLADRAEAGDTKAIGIYVDSILELAKKLDISVDVKNIKELVLTYANRDGENTEAV